jgi:GNAT superfamily N-acetyltransferase
MEHRRDEYCDWTLTDVPFAFFNNVFLAQIPDAEVDVAIERVIERAKSARVPYFWWTGVTTSPANLPESLTAAGFQHAFTAPAMAVDLEQLARPNAAAPGVTIDEVLDEAALDDWCDVMTTVYEFPEFALSAWRELMGAPGLGQDLPYRHYLARVAGQPVACASLYLSHGVAGISCVGTLESHRRKGIGAAITAAPLAEARRLGYRYGVLYSSPMGLSIYQKLGFQQYGEGACYHFAPEG